MISIDIPKGSISLLVDESVLKDRQSKWVKPEPKIKEGWLNRYQRMVTSGSKGAVLE